MLLLDPEAPEERRTQIVSDVKSMIDSGGSLVGEYDWGTRRMTFEIDHRPEAEYRLFQFEGQKDLLERLGHSLKIADGVLRFRTIKIKPGSPPPPEPRDHGPRESSRPRQDGPETVAPRAAADAPPPPAEGEPQAEEA
jgi:small subunit ribosomal protein S6